MAPSRGVAKRVVPGGDEGQSGGRPITGIRVSPAPSPTEGLHRR